MRVRQRLMLKNMSPKWTSLRSLGNSNLARLSILVPIIGYWIIFNEKIISFVTLAREFGDKQVLNDVSHVPWQLFWTYYGLLFIGIATGVYQLFCPLEIKKYESATDYVRDIFDVIGNVDCLRFMDKIENGDNESRSSVSRILNYKSLKGEFMKPAGSLTAVSIRNMKADVMNIYFGFLNRSEVRWRSLVGILYIVGFCCLVVPTGFIFWRVSELLLQR